MWVIANGAPKTGSTWPVQLLNATRRFNKIPEDLQDSTWRNSSVRDDVVEASVPRLAASPTWYLTKQHWFDSHKNLLTIPGIRILNSIRDIRDTFVSRYYHDVRLGGVTDTIQKHLHKKGQSFVRRYCEYQKYWIEAGYNTPASYYILSYERLSHDYTNAVRDLFDFCEVGVTDEEFARALDYGRFEKRDSGPGKFFRKGQVHAFSDDLAEEDVRYLMDLAASCGLPEIKRKIVSFSPTLRPFLEMTDVGV